MKAKFQKWVEFLSIRKLWMGHAMSRGTMLGVATCALAGSVACVFLAWAPVQSGLKAENPVCDFGQLGQGERVPAKFELVNQTSDPIRVVDVSSSCTCADLKLSKFSLSPGDRTILSVTWSTGSRRGVTETLLSVIYIRSVEGARAETTDLRLKAEVVPDYNYSPERLVFQVGSQGEQIVSFSPVRVSNLSLTRAYATHPAFKADLMKDKRQVRVAFSPNLWPGDLKRPELVVETNSKNEKSCRIELVVAGVAAK